MIESAPTMPPGPVINEILFEIDVESDGGDQLAAPIDLQVTYAADAVPQAERGRLVLGFFDGTRWSPLPEQTAEQAVNRVSAKASEVGIYALYRQP